MSNNKLVPTLGLWTCISLVVGGIIGSGIFMKPALMASQLGSPQLLIVIWILAGIMTLFGALSNAEVAAIHKYQHYRCSAAKCSIMHRLALELGGSS